jgi:hypothetical protein
MSDSAEHRLQMDRDRRIIALVVFGQNILLTVAIVICALLGLIPKDLDPGVLALIIAIVNASGIATGYILSYYFGSSADTNRHPQQTDATKGRP